MQVDPAQVRTLPPFDNPGVRQIGENQYEAVFLGSAWQFQPNEIRVPVAPRSRSSRRAPTCCTA
jgi:cytochrome c oxidase subunit 2